MQLQKFLGGGARPLFDSLRTGWIDQPQQHLYHQVADKKRKEVPRHFVWLSLAYQAVGLRLGKRAGEGDTALVASSLERARNFRVLDGFRDHQTEDSSHRRITQPFQSCSPERSQGCRQCLAIGRRGNFQRQAHSASPFGNGLAQQSGLVSTDLIELSL